MLTGGAQAVPGFPCRRLPHGPDSSTAVVAVLVAVSPGNGPPAAFDRDPAGQRAEKHLVVSLLASHARPDSLHSRGR